MRGLPFSAHEEDIFEFFSPLRPVRIEFLRGRDTRPSGECEVDFESEEELNEAMTYDKKFIGNRYIELFLLNNNNNNTSNKNVPIPNNTNFSNGKGNKNNGMMMNNNNQVNPKMGGRSAGGSQANSHNNSNNNGGTNGGIPSLFATPTMPATPGVGAALGAVGMTTAYPHQQMAAAAAVSGYPNNMGDMLMADMAKKMFQNAFAPYQNQMFQNQQIEGPQQQHFNQPVHKFNNRRGGGGGGGF